MEQKCWMCKHPEHREKIGGLDGDVTVCPVCSAEGKTCRLGYWEYAMEAG